MIRLIVPWYKNIFYRFYPEFQGTHSSHQQNAPGMKISNNSSQLMFHGIRFSIFFHDKILMASIYSHVDHGKISQSYRQFCMEHPICQSP